MLYLNMLPYTNYGCFIEIMPIGETEVERHLQFLPINEVFQKLNKKYFIILYYNY